MSSQQFVYSPHINNAKLICDQYRLLYSLVFPQTPPLTDPGYRQFSAYFLRLMAVNYFIEMTHIYMNVDLQPDGLCLWSLCLGWLRNLSPSLYSNKNLRDDAAQYTFL